MVKVVLRALGFDSRYCSIALGIIGIICFVIFPCLVKAFEFGRWNERFKEDFGFFVSDKSIPVNDAGMKIMSGDDVFSKEKYLLNEGFPEKSGGFVEFGDSDVFFHSSDLKAVFNNHADKISKDATESESNAEVNCNHLRLLSIGFIIGAGLAIFIYDFVPLIMFYFTQHYLLSLFYIW